jgi:[protein-PII] uridylyltransferase
MMSLTAQRKDISDPEVISEFAQKVENVEYLNSLYLLTVADIRATNPDLWNSWKDQLLRELYSEAHNAIRKGITPPSALAERAQEKKLEARSDLLKFRNARCPNYVRLAAHE